ncbi:MAG: Rieske 2Fe-2S domain-containing protein [Alphaproteobacteria bacterium]
MADSWIDESTWRYFWHPVCTRKELETARADGNRPLAVRLLGEDIVVADIGGRAVAFPDRCLHRSTKLSVGCIEDGGVRCAYHGWLYDAEGACVDIPAMPDHPIPDDFRLTRMDAEYAYDLVWVRLDDAAGTRIPGCPAWGDDAFRSVQGNPYTWPTSAGRRLENFVDLSHFPFVHDGSLGDRRQTVVPVADIDRVNGELRFEFRPSPEMALPDVALMAPTDYRIWMPFTVNLEFFFPDGQRSQLWMTASPIESGVCRSFWFTCRTGDQEGDDQPHLDFQDLVLAEDLPVIEAQNPPEIPAPAEEMSVLTDKVSNTYRRWLKELSDSAANSPAAMAENLATVRLETDKIHPDLTTA